VYAAKCESLSRRHEPQLTVKIVYSSRCGESLMGKLVVVSFQQEPDESDYEGKGVGCILHLVLATGFDRGSPSSGGRERCRSSR